MREGGDDGDGVQPQNVAASSGLLWPCLLTVWLVWGSTYYAIGVMVRDLPPLPASGARYAFAGLALLLAARIAGAPWPTRRQWAWALAVGSLLFVGGNGVVSWVSRFTPTSIVALMVATTPLWMVLIAWLAERQAPPRATWAGIACGTLGVAVLLDLGGLGAHAFIGAAVVILASGSWAWGSWLATRRDHPGSLAATAGVQQLAGGLALLAIGTGGGAWTGFDPATVHPASWAALAYLIVAGSILAFLAFAWLLRHAPPALATSYAYVNPLVAVLLGCAWGGEPFSWRTALGTLLIVLAVALVGRR